MKNSKEFHNLLKQPNSIFILFDIASAKFPVGTVAGNYKLAVSENPEIDAVRFHS